MRWTEVRMAHVMSEQPAAIWWAIGYSFQVQAVQELEREEQRQGDRAAVSKLIYM